MTNGHIRPVPPEWQWERDMPPAPAIRAGSTLYLSGQIALSPAGELVGAGDIKAQARQCFQNIQAILARSGGRMSDVVKLVTYFACPLSEQVRTDYWEVRREFFGTYRPASTGVQVSALIFPEVLLEIEAVAVLPEVAR
jgi:enamine deaminase RidA (YjgF/YER057c/UK114 family)